MSELIKVWIMERIGVIMNMDPEAFSTELMDGTLIAQILLNYNIINDKQFLKIIPTNNLTVAAKNFHHIQLWLQSIGMQVTVHDLEWSMEKPMSAIKLLYELYLKLHDKDGLFFTLKKRQNERLHPANTRFDVCTVDEGIDEEIVQFTDNDLCQQLVLHRGTIQWNKNRYKSLLDSYSDMRERYSKYLDKKYGLKYIDQFGKPNKATQFTANLAELDANNVSSEINISFDELAKQEKRATLKPKFAEDHETAAEILKNIKQKKRREFLENEKKMQRQKLLLIDLRNKLLLQQENELEECVSKKLLKQSIFEKQMTTKLFEIRQQTNNILLNRRFVDESTLKKREDEFLEQVFLREKGACDQEYNYYFERDRMLELHKRIDAVKELLYVKRRNNMCEKIVENLMELSIIFSEYKKKYETEPDQNVMKEWGNLFIKEKSLEPYLQDLIDLVVETESIPGDLEEIYCLEMDRQEALDQRDFENYSNFEQPWVLHDADNLNPIEFGMNILTPPTPLPPMKVAVCVNNVPNCDVLPVLQKLLNKRKIRVIEMEDVVNSCLEAFKSENGKENIENTLNRETAAALAQLNGSNPSKPVVPIKGNKQATVSVGASEPGPKFEERSTQTTTSNVSEGCPLSVKAEYGKIAYESLNIGNEVTDNLLVVMLLEYVRSLKKISGFALINYPTDMAQAALLEQALTGNAVPNLSSNVASIGDIADLNIRSSQLNLKEANMSTRQSKLLPNLSTMQKEYHTYFSAYISIKPDNIADMDNETENPLEQFYTEQGCNYELFYNNFELDTIKRLAKMILGEYSIPPKSSEELFGDTINYVKANLNQLTNLPVHGTEHVQEEKRTDELSEPVRSTSTILPEIKPGDPSWQYVDIPFPDSLQIALATLWENLEKVYIIDFKQVFFMKRILLNGVVPYLSHAQNNMRDFISRPDSKQNYLSDFQNYHNGIDNDMREDPEVKAEIHCAISKFRNGLYDICDNRMKECQGELRRIIQEHWLANLVTELVNLYVAGMQLEIDRCCDSFQFLNDYYSGVITKMPCREAAFQKTALTKLSNAPPVGPTLRVVTTLLLSDLTSDISNTPFHDFINRSSETARSVIAKFKASTSSIILQLDSYFNPKAVKKPAPPKKDAKEPQLPAFNEPDDDVKAVGLRLLEEWQCATIGECSRVLLRINMLDEQARKDLKIVFTSCQRTFHGLFAEIESRYEREVNSVNTACEVFEKATEAEVNLQPELQFEGDRFFIQAEVLLYPDEIPSPYTVPGAEPGTEYVFTMKQLDSLSNIFLNLAPNGSISERSFVFILQDLIVLNAEDGKDSMVPSQWQKLTPSQVSILSKKTFGNVEFINWKDFILYSLCVPFPTIDELLKVRNTFRCDDPDSTETVKDYQFAHITFWFENMFTKHEMRTMKNLLFKIYKVDEGTMNYTSFLLDFCKGSDVAEGFFKALTLAYGRRVCDNFTMGKLYVANIMEQRSIDERKEMVGQMEQDEMKKLVELAIPSLINSTVHVCDSAAVQECESTEQSQISVAVEEESKSKRLDSTLTEFLSVNFEENESVTQSEAFANVEISFEPCYDPDYIYIVPFDDVLAVLTASLPWHVTHQAVNDNSVREVLENIYTSLRNTELNNNVLAHELHHNEKFKRLLLRNFKFVGKQTWMIAKELVEN
ncbi:hypothetical protein RI129_009289 [Pyrocoelia pectoralis]|uniref:Sperm flagellar protein 2 n=1 Tax=Pyrocoelia pectoralis TaxID=417401 RepID=A0AAN7ZER0_9COLE